MVDVDSGEEEYPYLPKLRSGIELQLKKRIIPGVVEYGSIRIGNSGFNVVFIQREGMSIVWNQHFQPDDYSNPRADYRIKFSSVYAFALDHFLTWWNEQTSESLPIPRATQLIGSTNKQMHEFRKKLLGNEIYKEVLGEEREDMLKSFTASHEYEEMKDSFDKEYVYTLDLERLSTDEEVLKRIKRLSKWCERQKYIMDRA